MTPKLTDEMRDELKRQAGQPVTIEDDLTHVRHVLLPFDVYERVRAVFDDDTFDIAETYATQCQVAGGAGWDDPEMKIYDNYDLNRNSS